MLKPDNCYKICFVIPVLVVGGAERVMSEVIRYFSAKSDIECHLILYGKKAEIFYDIPETVYIHQSTRKFHDNLRWLSTIERFFFLRKKIITINPNIILSFGEIWNSFVLLSLSGLSCHIFISDRCQPDKSLSKLHERLRRWLYPKATGIIAQTEKAKEIYSQLYHHPNIQVIGNPMWEIALNQNLKKENIVLSVGRLIKSKHHDELIKLFVRLNKPDWKLIIVGDDALKQQNKMRLQALINKLGVTDRVILAGKRSDVEDFYRKSRIFAFTSSSEGFPNVIGEAMSAGLPVVAFDCIAGPSDMIEDGKSGFLVPLFDYATFETRLGMLMEDAGLRERLGQAAQVSIKRFSIEKIGQQFSQFLLPNE